MSPSKPSPTPVFGNNNSLTGPPSFAPRPVTPIRSRLPEAPKPMTPRHGPQMNLNQSQPMRPVFVQPTRPIKPVIQSRFAVPTPSSTPQVFIFTTPGD